MNNIVLISDDSAVTEALKLNLLLLRKCDNIFSCDFLSAENVISQNRPRLVVLYSPTVEEEITNFISKFSYLPIFYVGDEISDNDLLKVYESGACDYIKSSQSQTEFLIRVMACIKRSSDEIKYQNNSEILSQIGILKNNTEFYSQKYTPAVFKNLIKKYTKEDISLSILAIAPDIESKNVCNPDFLASILSQNLREDDIIGYGKDKLYILLLNTNVQGALDVYNKIKKIMASSCGICAGVLEIEKDMKYDSILKKVDEALEDALSLKNSVVVQENCSDEPPMNWLDKPKSKHKNFKLFKKAFIKKLETVITPVFYQKQQIAEQRLFEVKVKQSSNDKKSSFSLSKGDIKSLFEITYPGAVKINIDIYDNINESKEPEHFSYELNQINEKMLGAMLDKFIRKFQKNDKN